jgi:hypothetical protein
MKKETLIGKSMNGVYYVKVKLEAETAKIIDENFPFISDDSNIQQINVEDLMDILVKRGISNEELMKIYYGFLLAVIYQIKLELLDAGVDSDPVDSL